MVIEIIGPTTLGNDSAWESWTRALGNVPSHVCGHFTHHIQA